MPTFQRTPMYAYAEQVPEDGMRKLPDNGRTPTWIPSDDLTPWLHELLGERTHPEPGLLLRSSRGLTAVRPGDWVIQNHHGHIYSLDDMRFKASYVLAPEAHMDPDTARVSFGSEAYDLPDEGATMALGKTYGTIKPTPFLDAITDSMRGDDD